MQLFWVSILTFTINLPFGYWRSAEKKLSLNWFLTIHIPIPFVIFFRFYFDIGFALYTYPIVVAAFFLGQFSGKLFYKIIAEKNIEQSKCLCKDLLYFFKMR